MPRTFGVAFWFSIVQHPNGIPLDTGTTFWKIQFWSEFPLQSQITRLAPSFVAEEVTPRHLKGFSE